MRKKALLIALVMCIITGCKQNQQACAAYAEQYNTPQSIHVKH